MNIYLLNPPTIVEDTMNTQPIPLGLYSIYYTLIKNGCCASIINLSEHKSWGEVKKVLLRCLDNPDVVGISCYTRQRFSVGKLCQIIKEIYPSCFVCLGGPHASFLDIAILKNYESVDFIIRNEGEETFLELMTALSVHNFSAFEHIRGISYKKNGRIVQNECRDYIADLDGIPSTLLPYRELQRLIMSPSLLFHFPDLPPNEQMIAPIITSRGCSGNCVFCCNKAFWGQPRVCSSKNTYEQIQYYYNLGIRFFDFYDDNFTENIPVLEYLADQLSVCNLFIHWWCSSRADLISEHVIYLLEKAGCFMVSVGAESGSQYILNNIKKGITVHRIEQACYLVHKSNVKLRLTISIGHPGESIESINETIDLLNRVQPSQVALFILKVYPGTPLYKKMLSSNLISDAYWFDEGNCIVPYYTAEHTFEELKSFQQYIERSLRATVLKRYVDELGSIELDLEWK